MNHDLRSPSLTTAAAAGLAALTLAAAPLFAQNPPSAPTAPSPYPAMTPEHHQQMMEQMGQMKAQMEQMNAQMSQMKEKCKTMMGHGAAGSSDMPAGTNHQQHQQGTPNPTTGQ
ncbi:MAG: hypothetical protein KME26_16385 [Oscillatoria princeps RMCB-10]|jgi:hypothetical protein|nr:hypothetical protein [Oscillatoria princeps RMCB-10]